MHWWHGVQHWLAYMTGSENSSGAPPNYNFWSGFGSDLSELALAGGLLGMVRKYNCHAKWCWRIGRHPVEGTAFVVCRRHHPEGKPTAADIRARWHLYVGGRPGKG